MAAFICVLNAAPGFTETNLDSHPEYTAKIWQTSDGLPHNSVRAICQTRDGYLWIGTQEGLARFNGWEFIIFNSRNTPSLKNDCITALAETTDGSLWIGTKNGVVRFRKEIFKRSELELDRGEVLVRSLYAANDGGLWLGANSGAAFWKDEKWKTFLPDAPESGTTVSAITGNANGEIYLGFRPGLKVFGNNLLQDFCNKDRLAPSARALCVTRNGQVWTATGRNLLQFPSNNVVSMLRHTGLTHDVATALCEDSAGGMWVGTYGGLNLITSTNAPVEITDGTETFGQIYTIYEDREQSIWVGTKDGLVRLRPKLFTTYARQEGLGHNNVSSVMEDRSGRLWIGTWGGGLNYFQDRQIYIFSANPSDKNLMVTALCEDRKDVLWCGFDFMGQWAYLDEGKAFKFPFAEKPLPNKAVKVIRQISTGQFLIGARGALYGTSDNKLKEYAISSGGREVAIRDIAEDRVGRVWVATDDGVSILADDHLEKISPEKGFPDDIVYSIYRDAEDVLWFGTKLGLGFLENDRFNLITARRGQPNDEIFSVVEDDNGRLWMGSPRGVFSAQKSDLRTAATKGNSSTPLDIYDEADGLLSAQCSSSAQPSVWKTHDGRLWFATGKGVAVIDPRLAKKRNELVPSVVIEEVIVDKKVQTASAHSSVLKVEPGVGDLEIRYAALSLVAPEKNLFKYRLDGVDRDWVEAGNRRNATYNHVAPGTYTFRVIASNNDGVWNEIGKNIKFSLLPHFWQTWWFKLFAGLSFCALLTLAYRIRVSRIREIEQLRFRIAGDLHDDVGASLTKIAMLSEIASRQPVDLQRSESAVKEIAVTNRHVIRAIQEVVWTIKPKNDTLDHLASFMMRYAQDYFQDTGIRCRLNIPEELPNEILPTEVRHNLFLIFKEALNNIAKHSRATEVTVGISVSERAFVLTVEDNGTGFDLSAIDSARNGIANMRQRMERIGGHYDLASDVGKGTRISIRLLLQ